MNFIFSIGLIVGGLFLGQKLRIIVMNKTIKESVDVSKYMSLIQRIALLGINPVITLGAFWGIRLDDMKFIALPILGAFAISIGGVLGYIASKILKHKRNQMGSMFVTGAFTNMGNFGGLICFMFFGEMSYAYVAMYKMFEEILYFLIGYPIAKLYGSSCEEGNKKNPLVRIATDPFVIVYFSSMVLGGVLNISGIGRPIAYQKLNEILIPLSSILLITSVGYNMRIKAIGGYLKECFTIASIKFIIIPVVITSTAYVIGLGSIEEGLLLKVVLVLSAMPPAFNSLIPPQIYNLDADLANSCWMFCNGLLIAVVPVLYFLVKLL